MPAQPIAQMNIRMSAQLKSAGDKVLAQAGVTPTHIVRALWKKISQGAADLSQVKEVLGIATQSDSSLPSANASTDKMDAMRRGRSLFAEGLATWGISESEVAPPEEASDTDRYAEAMVERMKERAVW
jgi:antitoxin component of RelBE/YafQ-DinJ toxin-antitoxin module